MARELHLEERPLSFKQMVGQEEACQQMISMGKSEAGLPHFIMFTGPSGCGKTTLARIARNKLKCSNMDFMEINGASQRGVDMVRDRIEKRINAAPMGGSSRVWLIDEAHQLTPDAQGAILKLLEEPPNHAYIMFATTDPEKLRKAIRTRATEVKVRLLTQPELTSIVNRVMTERTGTDLDPDVLKKLVDVSDGSARKALVLLEQIMGVSDVKVQMNILEHQDIKKEAIEIARAVMSGNWPTVAKLIKACEGEPESIRWLILSYYTSVALTGSDKSPRAIEILEEFQYNYYDTRKAGLVLSCYNACTK